MPTVTRDYCCQYSSKLNTSYTCYYWICYFSGQRPGQPLIASTVSRTWDGKRISRDTRLGLRHCSTPNRDTHFVCSTALIELVRIKTLADVYKYWIWRIDWRARNSYQRIDFTIYCSNNQLFPFSTSRINFTFVAVDFTVIIAAS